MAFAIWVTGLPGCGKSRLAKEFVDLLKKSNISIHILNLDSVRKDIVPDPKYTEEERDRVYIHFVEMGIELYKQGKNILYDATGHRKRWREYARRNIPNFMEVYLKCPLDICVERSMKRRHHLPITKEMYKKALERKKAGKVFRRLGQVIGIDVPYEENTNAEMIIRTDRKKSKPTAVAIFKELEKRNWI